MVSLPVSVKPLFGGISRSRSACRRRPTRDSSPLRWHYRQWLRPARPIGTEARTGHSSAPKPIQTAGLGVLAERRPDESHTANEEVLYCAGLRQGIDSAGTSDRHLGKRSR